MSRLCEEFGCLPSQVEAELATAHGWEAIGILLDRAYARAKALFDGARSADDLPDTPIMDLVKEIDLELARAEIERAKTAR